ncbi:bifunctional 2-C-methyl-D-erythritol 4-phosphate cytidylyltransferase/2-C-methyl-D-erythritol 2,4-cyclodiphosphate synthase [Sphingomonas changnyeongensis]|uniref:Bifunctional enzyme IspD/IspF n=1 Tax=Sphingomonas changnyeongensis TaxID=2698679 RepID=A0A7Z2NWM6_9SPHN|nr:bifunctional 2-C-methyl-D-erythritol 4-phosphate cytidylyltransferase/2-C-methyl-D-erythritol 2,4-cyclodiphosphate synthase [Sphingomonas changnyeongensis]QHL91193.1 bifunctional 2-C-methyl-D-erythritol 4-phosphate cytidylyltransferase/2-C-methyl-D-erythritol 2,4-cyclodiphosphate synthase [Sphingomonas changnyeongensis]
MTDMIAVIVAAGRGERAGGGLPKQYRALAGLPLIAHAHDSLMRHPRVAGVVLVVAEGAEEMARAALDGRPVLAMVPGGATRRASVAAGLEAVAALGHGDRVLIHDAARPLIPRAVIDRLAAALDDAAGAVPVLPVADTLARGDQGALGDIVPRDGLQRVQTPQAFRLDAILAAHRGWAGGEEPTDDAQMLRALGEPVALVAGDPVLDKITHPADFDRAETWLAAASSWRTGMGYDVHRLGDGHQLWLGGINIPHAQGLIGHSDADVALHALTDAVLGAIGDGDIGSHFPPSDPQWRGAASSRFLEHAALRVARAGGRIEHVDLTIICEAPRIGPYRDAIRAHIAGLLRLPEGRISVKATTTERLGFTGRGEGIAAQAVATVRIIEALA